MWNPWHGCHKLSEGCRHCYVYRGDSNEVEIVPSLLKPENLTFPYSANETTPIKFLPAIWSILASLLIF